MLLENSAKLKKLCTNPKRGTSHCVWHTETSPVPTWEKIQHTTSLYLQYFTQLKALQRQQPAICNETHPWVAMPFQC